MAELTPMICRYCCIMGVSSAMSACLTFYIISPNRAQVLLSVILTSR